jgi:hypothetical protein
MKSHANSGLSVAVLVVFAAALSGCGGKSHATAAPPPDLRFAINKYTVTGSAPSATITAAAGNVYTGQLSVPNFGPTNTATLITIPKRAEQWPSQSILEDVTLAGTASFPTAIASPWSTMLTVGASARIAAAAGNPDDQASLETRLREWQRRAMAGIDRAAARGTVQQARAARQYAASALATPLTVGAKETFNVLDLNSTGPTPAIQSVPATCQHVGSSAYIFVDDKIKSDPLYDPAQSGNVLAAVSAAFDAIYSTDRATFGSEWGGPAPDGDGSGGIDHDPHVYILISPAVNSNGTNGVLGYFYGADEFPASTYAESNEHEMFYVVARRVGAGSDLFVDANSATHPSAASGYAVLAHEFQHMINFNAKFGHNGAYNGVIEDTWLDEGLSMYAMQACGYGVPQGDPIGAGHVANYLSSPDAFSLTTWTPANYGMSYLFVLYLVEHYGGGVGTGQSRTMLRAMESNGLKGIDNVTSQIGADSFATLFRKWAMTNLLAGLTADPTYNYASPGGIDLILDGTMSYGGVVLQRVHVQPSLTYSTYPQNLASPQLEGWTAVYQQFNGVPGATQVLNFSLTSTEPNNVEAALVVQ